MPLLAPFSKFLSTAYLPYQLRVGILFTQQTQRLFLCYLQCPSCDVANPSLFMEELRSQFLRLKPTHAWSYSSTCILVWSARLKQQICARHLNTLAHSGHINLFSISPPSHRWNCVWHHASTMPVFIMVYLVHLVLLPLKTLLIHFQLIFSLTLLFHFL